MSSYFTETEFDNLIQNLSNDITEDPIQLYMIASYKNSKLLNSSTYSKSNNFQVGEYSLCPHYNSQNRLVFYSAFRKSNIGIEYLIRADALNAFKEKYTTYKAAADLFYVNGKPSLSQIQIAAGDYWEGLLTSYKAAFSNPYYYLYLGHVLVGTSTNLKNVPNSNQPIKFTSITTKGSEFPNIRIENMSIQQYKEAISAKYGKSWIVEPNNPLKSRLQIGNKMYFEHPSTSSPYPSIDIKRDNVIIGKFRFNN